MDGTVGIAETGAGKAAAKAAAENFPVALRLLGGGRRRAVMAFYGVARRADDAADDPDLPADAKLERLDAIERGLAGGAFGLDGRARAHLRRLLVAFRADAVNAPVQSEADLLGYCRHSANPVGRFLLDLHGETAAATASADALCTALQLLNHLQDAGGDWRNLRRLYLPLDWMDEAGADPDMLLADRAPPALARVFARFAALAGDRVRAAAPLPGLIRSPGLRVQAAATLSAARRLHRRLEGADPIGGRVGLGRCDKALALAAGLARLPA
ncbi:MAG: squalene/phytoene synthase family protein [Geminicoccaceae bacterium]|nr:squalene/phytoene synthase family protein [Geminicoccaceae bacterium]